jgi:hypothetical protein
MEHASGNGSPTSSTSIFSHLDGRHLPQQPTTYRCPALAPAHHLSPQLCRLTRSLARRPRCISATATSALAPASMPSLAPPPWWFGYMSHPRWYSGMGPPWQRKSRSVALMGSRSGTHTALAATPATPWRVIVASSVFIEAHFRCSIGNQWFWDLSLTSQLLHMTKSIL